jgi:O-antigen/teichoic acid export membrane protein
VPGSIPQRANRRARPRARFLRPLAEFMSRLRVLLANIAAVVTGKAAAALAGLATIMVLTRHLGPQEFGYYRTALTYAAFASVLADCGIYMVTLREMSRPGGDPARSLGTALPLRLTSSISVLLLACALAWAFPYDRTVKWGVFIGAAVYTCMQTSEVLVAAFQSLLKQGRNAVAEAGGALATLGAVWILALLHGGALAMLGATFFGSALALAISWRLAQRLVRFRISFNTRLWRNYVLLGLPIAGSQILTMAILRGDSLVLSLFRPAAEVGLYGVPTKLFEVATSLAVMFGGLMMPALTLALANDRQEFPKILGHVVDTAAIYGIGAVLALAPFAPQLLNLIAGPEFVAGAPALVAISFAIGLAATSHVLRFALVACERPRLVLQADAFAFVVGFAAYFALIPRFSILGAAVGTIVAESCSLLGMLRGLKRAGQQLPSIVNLAKAIGAGLVALASMLAVAQFDVFWMLALLVGGAVYLAVLALTHAIPPELLAVVFRRRDSYQRSA